MIEAEIILGLGERFGKLPSELYAEPASFLRLLQIEALGRERASDDASPFDEDGAGMGGIEGSLAMLPLDEAELMAKDNDDGPDGAEYHEVRKGEPKARVEASGY